MGKAGTAGADEVRLNPGQAVRLLPVHGGRLVRGKVRWVAHVDPDAPPSVRVLVLPHLGSAMHGTRVWVTADLPDEGLLSVYEALVQLALPREEVDLVEVSLLADEPRRAALRAAAQRPVILLQPGKVSRGTVSLDLSSCGCRVAVPADQQLAAGQMVQVAVDLDAGRSVWADGQVVWVDDAQHVAALRFTRVDPVDQERLDRGVLEALSPRFGRRQPGERQL